MKIYIVADYREQFPSVIEGDNIFNSHPAKSSILDVQQAFISKNMECEYFGGISELINACNNHQKFEDDTLFINMSNGLTQSYCRVQAPVLLDLLGVKYTGSSPFTVALMNNKHYSKLAVEAMGVNIPHGIMLTKEDIIDESLLNTMKFPIIIKPNNDGYSVGITSESVVYDYNGAISQIETLLQTFDEVVVEEYISGIDSSVFLIGNKNQFLVNEVIVYKTYGSFHQTNTVRDIHAKASKLSEKYKGNEILNQTTIKQMQSISENIFNCMNAYDIARIDYRITENKDIYFLEINACPVLSQLSDAAVICNSMGITYADFIELYYKAAMIRYKKSV